jgi:predicted metal-dependent phosphoesterase TrpH
LIIRARRNGVNVETGTLNFSHNVPNLSFFTAIECLAFPMLKIELHAHTDHDPLDRIPHSARDLIDHAASLGYHGLAITLHDRFYDPSGDAAYARERSIVLLPGIERTVAGRHILLINFPAACASVRTFEDIARLKAQCAGLVVGPHPFYPVGSSLGRYLDEHKTLVDAIEVNAMYTRWLNFNRRAVDWALAHGKPIVGNTDLHLLEQLGSTYSLVDADPHPDAICEAIRAGRVQIRSQPLSTLRAGVTFGKMLIVGALGRMIGAGAHRA